MDLQGIAASLWENIGRQNWEQLQAYFLPSAKINWHNTGECFTVENFIRANSEYPGDWTVKIERLEQNANLVISVVKVACGAENMAFHAVSFFTFEGNKIANLDEYWGDDGPAPAWRQEAGLATSIDVR